MNTGRSLFRLIREIFSFYPIKVPASIFMILFCAAINTLPSVFIQRVIALIEFSGPDASWPELSVKVIGLLSVLAGLYVLSLLGAVIVGQLGAEITQGVLLQLRRKMFARMQNLPLRFFDSNPHGDIMSRYTNDVDSIRQMVSQAGPQMLTSIITVIAVLCIMLYFSLWLTFVTLAGIVIMFTVTKKVGGRSARNFREQQRITGRLEGFGVHEDGFAL